MKTYIGFMVVCVLLALVAATVMFWDAAAVAPSKKVITIRQVENGYVIERRVSDNPYPAMPDRVALTAKDASAEVEAYFNGPPIKPRWEQEKGRTSR